MFVCNNCQKEYTRFAAKCSNCGEYGTIEEREEVFLSSKEKKKISINPLDIKAKSIQEIEEKAGETPRIILKSQELNKFFWNWLTIRFC